MTDISVDLSPLFLHFLKKMTASLANKPASGWTDKSAPIKELAKEYTK